MKYFFIMVMIVVNGLSLLYGKGEEKRSGPQEETESNWVWDLPPEQQMKLVSIKVQVLTKAGRPIRNAHIVGYCRPWHYRTNVFFSDDRGEAAIQGPVGDWTFYAAAPKYLMQAQLKTQENCRLKIRPNHKYELALGVRFEPWSKKQLVLQQGSNGKLGFIHFQPINRLIPMLPIGFVTNHKLSLESTEGIEGSFWITRDMENGTAGFVFAGPVEPVRSGKTAVFYNEPARLNLIFNGWKKETRAVVSVYPENALGEVGRSAFIVPRGGGQAELLLNPGTYRVQMGIPGAESVVFLGKRLVLQPGDTQVIRYGNKFKVKPMVLNWARKRLQFWFHIEDNYGTPVHQLVSKNETMRFSQGDAVLYNGPSPNQRTRFINLDRDWNAVWQRGEDIQYSYEVSCQPIGTVKGTGSFRADPKIALNRNVIPVSASSDHFNIMFLNDSSETSAHVASALEWVLGWLSDSFAGPVRHRSGGKWDVRSISPVGVGWAGSGISVCLYAAEFDIPTGINGHTFVLFHELGHIYQSNPPNHQARELGTNTCESIASLISAYCMRAIHGELGYLFNAQNFTRSFFNRRMDSKVHAVTNPDDYDFIFNYVHSRFGERINRQFVKIMYRSEGNLEEVLSNTDFLRTEGERVAAVYSFLTHSNLAWLFRWAGEDVGDATIDQAIYNFEKAGVVLPQ